jgi:Mlc titration factor MtfA (ptsG expression regulator)
VKLFRRREVEQSAMLALTMGAVIGPAAAVVTQSGIPTAIGAGLAGSAVAFVFTARRWLRRYWLLRAETSAEVREVLAARVAFYQRLSADEQREFERNVRCFLAEHTIAGPQQKPVSDETRVLVAASAAILLFGREDLDLPSRIDVVVYPEAFNEEYEVKRKGEILGQAHSQGPVILSERALREGFSRANDGQNVGIHEFAHMLDLEGARFDGTPSGMDGASARAWAGLVHGEIARIERHRSILRQYGATNEAEFFAVASEAFFERPAAMSEKHPELYKLLKDFYGQDPAARASKG